MPNGEAPLPTLPGIGPILEGIRAALPPDWGTARYEIGKRLVTFQMRILCLAYAGLSEEEIRDVIQEETGRTLPTGPGTDLHEYVTRVRDLIAREGGQIDRIANCLRYVERYGHPVIQPQDVQRGRVLPAPDVMAPIPERPEEPMPPPAPPTAPVSGPATRPTTGAGGRIDPVALGQAMLRIWRNLLRWRQLRAGVPTIRIPMPQTPGAVRYPGLGVPPGGAPDMPNVSTSVLEGGWGNLISQALHTAATIWGPNQAYPGGAPVTYYQNGYRRVDMPGENGGLFDMPFMDVMPQGAERCMAGLTSPFAPSGGRGARAKTHVKCDPITGRAVWFKPAGRPLLWSGDLSACKRVRKIASRARRARGGR